MASSGSTSSTKSRCAVPLIMSWPGRIPQGKRCRRVVSAVDVAVNDARRPRRSGASQRGRPQLLRPCRTVVLSPQFGEDIAFSEYCTDRFGPPEGAFQRMIRREDWKYIYYHRQPPQLFNLKEDPDERRGSLGRPPGAGLSCRTCMPKPCATGTRTGFDERWNRRGADEPILQAWARHTGPEERYRWPLRNEMNWLA